MELILVVVAAIVVTAIAHRRGSEPALTIVAIGIAVSFAPGFEAPELERLDLQEAGVSARLASRF